MANESVIRPRVLIVGNFASSWSGTIHVCEGLATHLESRGWRVLTTSHREPRLQRLSDMLGTTWETRREYDVAIVEVFGGPAFVWAEAVCRLLNVLKKPYILSLRGGSLPLFATRHRRRMNRVVARSAVVIAQSGYLAAAVPDHEALVRLIPNPVDLQNCQFRPRLSPEPKMAWLRSFHEIYNPSLAVEAASLLVRDYPNLVLTMIGPDKGDGSLTAAQDLAARLGVQQAVRFQPGISKQDVPQWLNRADVFLNTTNVDNTPVSVQEAMACGLCVVSTSVGGVPYLIEDQVDGLLVPPRDAHAMARAVRRLLTEPDLATRLSLAAREKVKVMDWSQVVEKWEEVLLSTSDKDARRVRQSR